MKRTASNLLEVAREPFSYKTHWKICVSRKELSTELFQDSIQGTMGALINCQLSRHSSARGSSTRLVPIGPTKVKAYKSVLFTEDHLSILLDW